MAVLIGNSFTPTAGEFYKAADGIRFRLKQTLITTSSYIACDARILTIQPVRNTSAAYPYWRYDLRNDLAALLPFQNQPLDTFFDLPLVKNADGLILDVSGLTLPGTVTVPIAVQASDLSFAWPSNDADPPIVTSFNPSTSFDYTIGYYATGASYQNAGKFARAISGAGQALTYLDFRVSFPSATASGETRFYNQLNVFKPPATGVWTVQFNRQLRENNINGRATTL